MLFKLIISLLLLLVGVIGVVVEVVVLLVEFEVTVLLMLLLLVVVELLFKLLLELALHGLLKLVELIKELFLFLVDDLLFRCREVEKQQKIDLNKLLPCDRLLT